MNPIPHAVARLVGLTVTFTSIAGWAPGSRAMELTGLSVVPHSQSPEMRYRRPPDPELGARVELFLRNDTPSPIDLGPDFPARFDGVNPADLLARGDWAWHDTPSARSNASVTLPPGALTVWCFNSRGTNWGAGTEHTLQAGRDAAPTTLRLNPPRAWLSAVTFLGTGTGVSPGRAVIHVANDSGEALSLRAFRLWLPSDRTTFRALLPQPWQSRLHPFGGQAEVPTGGKGGFTVDTGPLPLTYAAVEVRISGPEGGTSSLWAHLRIKREVFDIGGGWVASGLGGSNTLSVEAYLRMLKRLHVNTGMHQDVPGYTDRAERFEKYPLKYMNRLQPIERYDTDAMLPRIHAVEFLGEPQYGGGRPVPPQEVFAAFLPYGPTRLPSSVTHSEERIWRYYAGLSDYPHYDAYRVCAPAPDAWSQYDRWDGQRLRWGAPLETIGDMTRSLRDLNRPRPIAAWSQGAHDGWGRTGGRLRTSPTPDELRSQAWHALAQRITSLYWFNLSLKSLVRFRDLIEPITRVDREIRLLQDLLLSGDALEYRRDLRDGRPDWDLASVAGPDGALLVALDLDYHPDPAEKVFAFRPRDGKLRFRLPPYLPRPADVFRLDADGVHDVRFTVDAGFVEITDRVAVVGIYIAAPEAAARAGFQRRQVELTNLERDIGFDPGSNDADFSVLRRLLP